MTVKQFAQRVGISESLAYALIAAKKIRHERHGLGRGKIVIPEDAVNEYRRRCTVDAGEPEPAAAPVEPAPSCSREKRMRLDLW